MPTSIPRRPQINWMTLIIRRANSRPFSLHSVLFSILQLKQHAPQSTSVPQGAGRHKGDGWKPSWSRTADKPKDWLADMTWPRAPCRWKRQASLSLSQVNIITTDLIRMLGSISDFLYPTLLHSSFLPVGSRLFNLTSKRRQLSKCHQSNIGIDVKEEQASMDYSHWPHVGRDTVPSCLTEVDQNSSAIGGPIQKEKARPAQDQERNTTRY